MIQKLGKPADCVTFNDYANVFYTAICKYFKHSVKRVDVIFDRYYKDSIKNQTRNKRLGSKHPIRKVIDLGDVPLPQVWPQFLGLDENKANLAAFLSEYIMTQGVNLPNAFEIVTSGGCEDAETAKSTWRDVGTLGANHEEADTRLILHGLEAASTGFSRLEVICQDTDVFLMLIHFFQGTDKEIWMISGTARQRKCYPVHQISEQFPDSAVDNILGFHALTGCDTTSSFSGFGKKKAWKVFLENPILLNGVGRDGPFAQTEEFVCRMYSAPNPKAGADKSRYDLFSRGKKELEMLPPTKDALQLHHKRANYQAKIWLQAGIQHIDIEEPASCGGWVQGATGLEVVWKTLPPVPRACIELITCGCKSKCKTAACKCASTDQVCTPACGCNAEECRNPAGQVEDSDEDDD